MTTVSQRVQALRNKAAQKRAAEGTVSIAEQRGGATITPAPPSDQATVERAPSVDFQQFGLPGSVISTEDPRSRVLSETAPTYKAPSPANAITEAERARVSAFEGQTIENQRQRLAQTESTILSKFGGNRGGSVQENLMNITKPTDQIKEWQRRYETALKAGDTVGSQDVLNEFQNFVRSQPEFIEYSSKETELTAKEQAEIDKQKAGLSDFERKTTQEYTRPDDEKKIEAKDYAQRLMAGQAREEANPVFQNLTEQERQLNMFDIDPETGKLVPRETPKIAPTVSADTGRMPIQERGFEMSSAEKAALWRTNLENARNRVSPNNAATRATIRIQEQEEIDRENLEDMRQDLKDFKISLGLERNQDIVINEDGTVDVVDKETGEIFDPIQRAEERYNRDKAQEVRDSNAAQEKKIEQLKSLYSKDDGTLTEQGKREILLAQNSYNTKLKEYEEKSGEKLEEVIVQEKSRQKKVESVTKKKPTVE